MSSIWDRGDLVRLLVRSHLGQRDTILRRPGVDDLYRPRARRGLAFGPSHGLPVDRDRLEFEPVGHRLDPTEEALLKVSRMDDREDTVESVVGRDAVFQFEAESIPEPLLLGLGELSHADEVVGPADGRDDDDQDDVQEVVDAFELDSWVREFGEVVRQRSRGGRHDNTPGGWSGTLSNPTSENARGPSEMGESRAVFHSEHQRMNTLKS